MAPKEGEILFMVEDDVFCIDKIGRKVKIKTFHQKHAI